MATLQQARRWALALPETTRQDHHGMDSFRVRGRIIATVPDEAHLRVMAGEAEILAAVAEYPEFCAPYYWGSRLACVVVTLGPAPAAVVRELLSEAWRSRAPVALLRRQEQG